MSCYFDDIGFVGYYWNDEPRKRRRRKKKDPDEVERIDYTRDCTVEYYIDGKLFKSCPYKKWNALSERIKNILRDKGFHEVYSDNFYKYTHGSSSDVYVNLPKRRILVLEYKINTGHCDMHGYPIYEGDIIENDNYPASELHGHYNNETFYIQCKQPNKYNPSSLRETDVDIPPGALEGFRKVKDVLDMPKKFWKKPQTTRL